MSTIEVHQNTIDYVGHALHVRAVYLDGQLASDRFEPFKASCNSITSEICEECFCATGGGISTCGDRNIGVYWFFADAAYIHPLRFHVPLDYVWSFAVDDYETELQGSTVPLPDFTLRDMRTLLGRGTTYPRQLGLYVIPDIDEDPQGRLLLDAIQEIAASPDLTICDPPRSYSTVRIGIETEGVPEVVIEIGTAEGERAIRFVANPGFPLWLTSRMIPQRIVGITVDQASRT